MVYLISGTIILLGIAPLVAFRHELHGLWVTRQARKKYGDYTDF